jgi:asparagine synthase (glutamine-hydrolyzing)
MCGIAGKLYLDTDRYVAEHEVRRMADIMIHRGPDGGGVWVEENVGLAHRRLAIIDLRPDASQPMCNEDGSIWITFNGEIYNFRELRNDLEARGHTFKTNSDTETIIHAFEEYGRDCVARLRGMFAFAIWNTRTRSLFLARDRLGKKPLFYARSCDRFVFASEIKAILADESIPIEVDPVALDHYLALGYIPAPLSAFRGIQKLPPAHWLEFSEGKLQIGRYWKLRYEPKQNLRLGDAIAELRSNLAEAVRLRLVSDVPLGVFLSGGIDSSAIVAFMARAMDTPVQTFSVGFENEGFDERPFARMVAERYGAQHTELLVNPKAIEILPKIVWHYDEPFGDPSAVPSYAISELTRQYVKVVLNGDGGDENFAGYNRYVKNRRARRGDIIPLALRQNLAGKLQCLPEGWRQRQPLRKLATVAQAMAQEPERRYSRWFGQFGRDERQALYTEEFRHVIGCCDPERLFVNAFAETDAEDWTDATLYTDINLYLPEDLLVKMDRASMAHSVEARSPFLDHVFMEFAATLPVGFKLAGGEKKRILRTALRGIVPDAILDRPKKGFDPPIAQWLRTDLREMTHDILLAPRSLQRGYFNHERLQTLLVEHDTAQEDHSLHLWELLMLELWHRAFVDRETPRVGLSESVTQARPDCTFAARIEYR